MIVPKVEDVQVRVRRYKEETRLDGIRQWVEERYEVHVDGPGCEVLEDEFGGYCTHAPTEEKVLVKAVAQLTLMEQQGKVAAVVKEAMLAMPEVQEALGEVDREG